MKTIVTGSSGFIGSRLCCYLQNRGDRIIKVSRTRAQDCNLDLICDLEIDRLDQGIMSGIDTVFHLAGYAHDLGDPEKSRTRYFKLNVDATKNLALQASKEGVKNFVFVSSVKAGSSKSSESDLEDSPDGIYGISKKKAELELKNLANNTDMKIFIIRPALVYGPEIKGNLSIMRNAIEAGWFPPLPQIGNVRSMIHVDDLVRAIIFVLEKGKNAEIYNATDGKEYSTTDIYETLHKITGKNPPKYRIPLFLLNLLRYIPGVTKHTVSKLLDDEIYSSSKIQSLGFSAELRFGDMNETLF